MGFLDKLLKKNKSIKLIKLWEFDSYSELSSSPVVTSLGDSGETVIVFGTKDGKIYAVDDEAKVKWLYDLKQKLTTLQSLFYDSESTYSIYTTPVIDDIDKDNVKEIIVGSDSRELLVLDINGQLKWKFKTGGKIRSTPLLYDINKDGYNEIIFGSQDNHLYCLDCKGNLIWKYDANSPIDSSPNVLHLFDEISILFGTDDGRLIALNEHGHFKWDFKTRGKIIVRPTIANLKKDVEKQIIFGSYDKNLYCLTSFGSLLWNFQTEGRIVANAVVADINNDGYQEIIFGSCDNKVYALNHNGELLWDFETDFWIVDTPIISDIDDDGKLEVIVGSFDKSLYILDSQGTFIINYIPGISTITPQYNLGDLFSKPVGSYKASLLGRYKLEDLIIGTYFFIDKNGQKYLLIGIKSGKIHNFGVNKR